MRPTPRPCTALSPVKPAQDAQHAQHGLNIGLACCARRAQDGATRDRRRCPSPVLRVLRTCCARREPLRLLVLRVLRVLRSANMRFLP